MGSGGTGLGPGEVSTDQLVHHNFKGTWKKGYVDYDSHATGSSTAAIGSASDDGIRGSNNARMVSDASAVEISVSATAGISSGAGDGTGDWCVSQSCCSKKDTAVLATAVVPAEGQNRTGVTAFTLAGPSKGEQAGGMQAVWVRFLEKVPRNVYHAPRVSAAALCHSNGGDGAVSDAAVGAIYKAGRGAVHDNPSGRFKHKSIHFDGPPMISQERKGSEKEDQSGAPLVYITAHVDQTVASSSSSGPAAFAVSVRNSLTTKFEVNAVRLDHKASGWQQELYVDYLVLPRPMLAAGGSSTKVGDSGVLKTAAGRIAARYGSVLIGAQSTSTTIWVHFQEAFQQTDTASDIPTVVLTAQATSIEADQGRDEVFTVVLGPNATSAEGFAATIARTDESAKSSWSQPVQLNWLAFAPG